MTHFDNLDRELIALLRKDGRAPLSKLAHILGVSRGTVQNRINRLCDHGTILGFTVRVQEHLEVDAVRAIMMIEVAGRSTTQIIAKLRGLPDVHKLGITNGAWGLVADIHTPSLAEFDRVLRTIRAIEGILNSETSILLSSA